VASLDILGNVVPYIGGEEEKIESETRKMLGRLESTHAAPSRLAGDSGLAIAEAPITISAQCNRVPVRDGHMECLSIEFGHAGAEHKPDVEQIIAALEAFRAPPEVADLPSTPAQPVVVRREADRPQPLLDREAGKGTSVTVGRIRPCPVLDCKFVLLGHNTLRGAAGGSIHNAELLVSRDDAAMLRG
jgi:aspartate-semialdehyde dehydrogenase